MSGAVSGSRDMGFDDENTSKTSHQHDGTDDEGATGSLGRQMSEASLSAAEEEEDDDSKLQLGPQYTIKEHLEKDKDDESLRKWKEQLLGSVDVTNIGETLDPEVKIISLAILSPGRPDIVLMVPENGNPKGMWFTLKEGSKYNLKFTFHVNNNIVSGLRYTNTVWKTGVKVDRGKEMLGTFSPQSEPYNHVMPEETTPSGMFARGSYSARTKFLDDDNKCYLEINYSFDIRKEWAAV
ncbi:Rho GDP-dissociation inhibitor 1 [Raphanus sativus]|uniref:Rho GDP-dissociation inhibitor 1 isoform X1 n=2 Tax=Raphanus sativus TaxID=3726 RepID=A0A6J0NLX5_RAPSA|nr:rho GDP-dissociation inhibitor 1 isoform X1 [Raphanus sativus]KAJ4893136.1 Rho GDP-dissociation inhibitor 1 [Raphanus sativus]